MIYFGLIALIFQSCGSNTEKPAQCSIRLIEYKLLNEVKDSPQVSPTKPVIAIRISFTFAFDKSSNKFALPIDKIILKGSNGRSFSLNYLGHFNEKIDEFSLLRLDTLTKPKEITYQLTTINNNEECSNFIYFPSKEGKAAFLLFDGSMCDKSTQTIHLGFDVDNSSEPYSLTLANSNIIKIPK